MFIILFIDLSVDTFSLKLFPIVPIFWHEFWLHLFDEMMSPGHLKFAQFSLASLFCQNFHNPFSMLLKLFIIPISSWNFHTQIRPSLRQLHCESLTEKAGHCLFKFLTSFFWHFVSISDQSISRTATVFTLLALQTVGRITPYWSIVLTGQMFPLHLIKIVGFCVTLRNR